MFKKMTTAWALHRRAVVAVYIAAQAMGIKDSRYKIMAFVISAAFAGMTPFQITELGMCRTFQNIKLFPHMTIMENAMVGAHTRIKENLWDVFFHTKAYKKAEKQAEERAQKALELTGLSDNPYYYGTDLPYGKQRRLEIARAIASDPEVLMFDEPAAGMNEGETADLTGFIRETREAG